jgi:hypothetical protein
MDRGIPTLDHLVNAARRKWVAVRAIEHAVIGAVAGAALAIGATGILWWHARPSLAIAGWLIGMATTLGGVFSLLRCPSRVAAARRLDEQHRLHDLFSTAVTLGERDDPAMASTVRALAASAAGRIAGGEAMRVARWGGRGYAAAVMTVCLAIALSAVASQDALVVRGGESAATPSAGPRDRDATALSPASDAQKGETDPQADFVAERASESRDLLTGAPPRGNRPGGASDGASAGANDDHTAQPAPDRPFARQGPPPVGEERSRVGLGPQGSDRSHSRDAVYGQVDRVPGSVNVPFAARLQPVDRATADEAIRRGAVPEAYRDLVRAYFLRD